MPNPPRLDLVHKAIREGNLDWDDSALRVFRENPDNRGITPKGVKKAIQEFVVHGQKLKAKVQGKADDHWRNQDSDNPYWYMAVIPTPNFRHGLFVKVVIVDYDENQPFVEIVSCHEQKKL